MDEKLAPTHILTIEVPLRMRLDEENVTGPLEAAMSLVQLAFRTEVCDNVRVAIEPTEPHAW